MNLIVTDWQHNFDFHMNHNSNMGTNNIGSIFNSDKVVFRWREIEIHYIVHGDELWIPCSCNTDTPNTNLYTNMQHTDWQTERDLAAAPTTVQENPEAAVAALIIIAVAGLRAATAAMIIITLVPVAIGLAPMKMTNHRTNPGAKIVVTKAQKVSRWVIAMTMTINRNPHVEQTAYSIPVVILPVWTTNGGYWHIQLNIWVWLTITRCEHLVLPTARDRLVQAEMTIPAFYWLCLVANT